MEKQEDAAQNRHSKGGALYLIARKEKKSHRGARKEKSSDSYAPRLSKGEALYLIAEKKRGGGCKKRKVIEVQAFLWEDYADP